MDHSPADYVDGHISAGDGVRLYFCDYGHRQRGKTVVLCLSGLTRNSKDFHRLARGLAQERRVITLDFRGRGRSDYDRNWKNYHPVTYISDVRHVLVALNLHRVFIIGTSLGGIVAMGMGAVIPTVLAGVLLNDVGPELSMSGLLNIRKYMEAERNYSDWASVASQLARFFPEIGLQTIDDWELLARLSYRQRKDGAIAADWDENLVRPLQVSGFALPDLWPMFRSLRNIPVVTLRGEKSSVLSADSLARMRDCMPSMSAVTIPGAGHVPSLAEPLSMSALAGALSHADSA